MKYHVLVGTHHKTGTVWMDRIFQEISKSLGVPYLDLNSGGVPWRDTERRYELLRDFISRAQGRVIVFEAQSHFPALSSIDAKYKTNFRGIHMIRDPRDVAISAASYHARAAEPWLHVPQQKFTGLTYQEKNKSFPTLREKILFELDYSNRRVVREMICFDGQGVFRDVKYEDMIEDTKLTAWQEILSYLGFEETELKPVLEVVWAKSLFGGEQNEGVHITSGAKEQWRHVFDTDLLERYTNQFGADLVKLGYPVVPPEELAKASSPADQATESRPDTTASPRLRDEIEAKLKRFDEDEIAYGRLLQRLRLIMERVIPPDTVILVVSKGDNELVEPGSERAWHFPRTEDGLYLGDNPADSTDAVSHLEALRQKGAGFLLFPNTEFWWLDYYSGFRRHLDDRYHRIADNDDCIIYDLRNPLKTDG